MAPEQAAVFLQSQIVCAIIEAMGMHAENMQRQAVGNSMAYSFEAFRGLIEQYGIHHNAALTTLAGMTADPTTAAQEGP